MTRDEIASKLIELAAEQAGVDKSTISLATHFVNDLNFDSLDVVEYAMEVEDEFEISIPDEEVEKMLTVELVVDYVADQRAKAPTS